MINFITKQTEWYNQKRCQLDNIVSELHYPGKPIRISVTDMEDFTRMMQQLYKNAGFTPGHLLKTFYK